MKQLRLPLAIGACRPTLELTRGSAAEDTDAAAREPWRVYWERTA